MPFLLSNISYGNLINDAVNWQFYFCIVSSATTLTLMLRLMCVSCCHAHFQYAIAIAFPVQIALLRGRTLRTRKIRSRFPLHKMSWDWAACSTLSSRWRSEPSSWRPSPAPSSVRARSRQPRRVHPSARPASTTAGRRGAAAGTAG